MTSAGNDIVSLTAINVTRTKSPEFYSKIISDLEQELFTRLDSETLSFEHFIWLLWSVKEATFKYLHRMNPGLLFTPVKFVVSQLELPSDHKITGFGHEEIIGRGFEGFSVITCKVSTETDTLYSKTLIYREFISSVVNDCESFDNVYWGIKQIERDDHKYQSAAVRGFAVERLCQLTGMGHLAIAKNVAGVPALMNGEEEMGVAVSLSHHERWATYSFPAFAQASAGESGEGGICLPLKLL